MCVIHTGWAAKFIMYSSTHLIFAMQCKPYLILPFEFRPHGTELSIGASRGNDVVHDVDVDIVQNHTVAVACPAADVIHDVAKNDAVLCGSNFHTSLDDKRL